MAKKTTVKITGISQARDNAIKFLNQSVSDESFLNQIAEKTVDQLKKAVRSAGRTDPDYVQPQLKESTIDRRKTLIKQGNSFDAKIVAPKRSNLSLSGQLLEAISYRTNQALVTITLFLKKPRKPYKGAKGQNLENKDNIEVKNDLEKRGFRFFFVSEKINRLITNEITKQLRRKLSLYNKVFRKLS